MNNHDIAIKKEALLLHGEWLRMQMRLNVIELSRPLNLAAGCLRLISFNRGARSFYSVFSKFMPSQKIGKPLAVVTLLTLSITFVMRKIRLRNRCD